MVTSSGSYGSFSDVASPALSSPYKSQPPPASDTTYLKFLASNDEAGSIIGKGGSTISDFQSRSNARILLSRFWEYYPGTSDRIIMVSGTLNEVLDAFELILTKLVNEFNAEDSKDAEPRTKLRLLVPNGSCGGIIGKGGSMIKSFIEDSEANIKISPQDNSYIGLNDRLVTVAGTLQQQMVATDLILSKLSEDLNYIQSIGPPFTYPTPHSVPNYRPNGSGMTFQNNRFQNNRFQNNRFQNDRFQNNRFQNDRFQNNRFQNNKEDVTKSVTLAIADHHVGIVVGRSGRNIAEITQISGARIQISGRGDFIHGTTDRKVTITGSQRQINVAEAMILRMVASSSSPPPASTPET